MNTTTLNMTTLDGGVIIKKGTAPAPPSGESASTMEYLDVRNYDFSQVGKMGVAFSALCSASSNINTQVDDVKLICPWGLIVQLFGSSNGVNTAIAPKTKAFAIYPEMKINSFSPEGIQIMTVVEFLRATLSENGVDYDAIPRLTKEEFYNLD